MTAELKQDFCKKGFAGPITLLPPEEILRLRHNLEGLIQSRRTAEKVYSTVIPVAGDGNPLETIYDAHLDNPDVRSLATHPLLSSLAADLLDADVVVWRTTFWIKSAGARRLEWHQDTYKEEGFGSFPNLNAWIALDETEENNCVWLVDGTHREIIDLDAFKSPEYVQSLRITDALPSPPGKAAKTITKMVLQPGQFFLFDGRTLHGSPPNKLTTRRAGIVIRFIPVGTRLPGLKTPFLTV